MNEQSEPAAESPYAAFAVYGALDDVARQVTLTVSRAPQAAASAVVPGDSSDADGATDAPAASTATEGNTK